MLALFGNGEAAGSRINIKLKDLPKVRLQELAKLLTHGA
ncbi:MAG: hypothetical protein PWP44_1685 [Thermacetogenium sp.]|nr:hypothetical protein [Thermacetogenium sp.]